jgi:hypothetical protein
VMEQAVRLMAKREKITVKPGEEGSDGDRD